MSKKKDAMCIYVALDKKSDITVDGNATFDDEDKAIKAFMDQLESEDEDKAKKFDEGDDIKLYLYRIDKDNKAHPYKCVEVEKDDDNEAGYSVDTDESYDLPEDFKPCNSEDDDNKSEDTEEEDNKEDDEEEDEAEKKSGSKEEETDDEGDSEDDVREIEEATHILNQMLDYFYEGIISDETLALNMIVLEAVVGRKSIAETEKRIKDDKKEIRKYFHLSHTGGKYASPEDKEKIKDYKYIDSVILDHSMAQHKLKQLDKERDKQRLAARERIEEYRKGKRKEKMNEMRASAQQKLDSAKSKIKDTFKPDKKPLTEAVNDESTVIARSLATLVSLYNEGAIDGFEYFNTRDSLLISYATESHDNEYLIESVDRWYDNAINNLVELESALPTSVLDIEREYIREKVLSRTSRKELDDSEFGIPSLRKYPINDKAHVTAAIVRFNFVDKEHEAELAKNIIKALKKFDMLKTVRVSKVNRFKKYLDKAYETFKESYDLYPVPYMKEFNVGAMLPMMGSRSGWGTPLANTDIEDLIAKDNKELEDSACLYDCNMLYNESFLPQKNTVFDSEVNKLVKALKPYINNPKNDFLEEILKKSLNFKKNAYTIKLKDQDGKESDGVIKKIKSAGFDETDDQGVKLLYEKTIGGILITLMYDSVGDKIRVTYEETNGYKKESTDDMDLILEGVDYDFYNEILDERYKEIKAQIETANITSAKRAEARIVSRENYQTAQKYFAKMKANKGLLTKLKRFFDRKGAISKKKIGNLLNDYFLLSDEEIIELDKKKTELAKMQNDIEMERQKNAAQIRALLTTTATVASATTKVVDAKYGKKDTTTNESVDWTIYEASKDEIDSDIRGIIDKLNRLGYTTKYSCSGHTKARIKKDGFRNGIYHGDLYSTARIVFDRDFKLTPPEGWEKKTFDDKIGFYVKPVNYKYSDGMPDEAFDKWKEEYMANLKTWVDNLGEKPGPDEK